MKILVPFLLGLFLACGGGGGSSPSHPPSISNMQYTTPNSFPINAGNGAVDLAWTFDFMDAGGDITTVVLEALDANGAVTGTKSFPLTGMSGVKAGTAYIDLTIASTTAGQVPFKFHVQDSAGSNSNDLSGMFTITAAPAIALDRGAPEPRLEGLSIQTAEGGHRP